MPLVTVVVSGSDGNAAAFAEVIEDFAPLPILVLSVAADSNEQLAATPGFSRVYPFSASETRLIRGIAAICRTAERLALRAPNGWPGRLPAHLRGNTPAYPVLNPADKIYPVTTDPSIIRVGPMAIPSALNLSQAPPLDEVPSLEAIGALRDALEFAGSSWVVVVAAGNEGESSGDSMSALARIPNVVSVGATRDSGGCQLDRSSSRGAPRGPGPTVVSFGESALNSQWFGTSFAAPRVSAEIAVLSAFLRTAVHSLVRDEVEAVPLSALGVVDDGPPPDDAKRLAVSANPIDAGVDLEVAQDLAAHIPDALNPIGTHTLRAALIRSAQPRSEHDPSAIGFGFVDASTTEEYLASFTVNELCALMNLPVPNPPLANALLSASDIASVAAVWRSSFLIDHVDISTQAERII